MREKAQSEIRQMKILEKLKEKESVSIQELAKEFGVTSSTIRNDLKKLDELIPIELFYGGAKIQDAWLPCSGSFFRQAMQRNREAKRKLAAYVVKYLIKPGDRLVLDIGSTLTIFAIELKNSGLGGIKVASHSISVPLQLMESAIEYIQLGGILHRSEAVVLPIKEMLSDWFPWGRGPYKAVMTAAGFSIENGATTRDPYIVHLDQRYMMDASEIIMILDHSKFFVKEAATTTMCGLTPEEWLSEEKKFTLITDVDWDDRGEAEEYRKLANKIVPKIPDDKEFSSVRIFESTLNPMP